MSSKGYCVKCPFKHESPEDVEAFIKVVAKTEPGGLGVGCCHLVADKFWATKDREVCYGHKKYIEESNESSNRSK